MPQSSSPALLRFTSPAPTRGAERRGRAPLALRQQRAALARTNILQTRAASAVRHNEYVDVIRARAVTEWAAVRDGREGPLVLLEERQDSAARVRAELLEVKAATAGRHNEYVNVVRARAVRAFEEKMREREAEVERRLVEAEVRRKRGREGSGVVEKRLKRVKANREEMCLWRRGRTEERLREAERRRCLYLERRSQRAARLTRRVEGRVCARDVRGSAGEVRGPASVSSPRAGAVMPVEAVPQRKQRKCSGAGKNRAVAARRIARFWLISRARRRLAEAGLLPPPAEISSSFERTAGAMESRSAGDAAQLFLRAIGANPKIDRLLLACFIPALHPQHVLDSRTGCGESDENDESMLLSARRLVLCMHAGSFPALAHAWAHWRSVYPSWLRTDRERLRAGIVSDALATEALRVAIRKRFREGAANEAVVWETELDNKQLQLRAAMLSLAGEAEAVKLDAEVRRVRQMPDETIAHEIMVDLDGFLAKLVPPSLPPSSWLQLRSELLASPPRKGELFFRLQQIERQLNGMRPGSFEPLCRGDLNETDAAVFACGVVERASAALKLSQAQADDEALDDWLGRALVRLAGARAISDSEALVSVVIDLLREFTERLGKVHETVSVMRIRIECAPIVQQYGVACERARFEDRVKRGEVKETLPILKSFLQAARLNSSGVLSQVTPSASYSRALLREALVIACCSQSAITFATAPEIFGLDVERLVAFQNDMQRAALLAALDNAARQFLSSARPKGSLSLDFDVALLRTVLECDSSTMETVQDALIAAVATAVGNATLSAEEEALLRGIVVSTMSPSELFKLVFSRVSKLLRRMLVTAERGEQQTAEQQPILGLAAVQQELSQLAGRMEKLAAHTYNVHGVLIMSIAASLE